MIITLGIGRSCVRWSGVRLGSVIGWSRVTLVAMAVSLVTVIVNIGSVGM